MNELNLQNFTSVFEIFFGYHLLNAFSDKLRNFLNIHSHVSSLIDRHTELNNFKSYLEAKSDKRKVRFFGYLNKIFVKTIERSKCRFYQNKLFFILKSAYIYFGLLSFTYLIFSGLLDIVISDENLMLINSISSLVAIFYLIASFRASKHKISWGPIRIFFTTVIIVILIAIIPQKIIIKNSMFPIMSINIFDFFKINGYRNILVIWSLCLVLSPILIELLHVFLCVSQLKLLKLFTGINFIVNEIFFSFTTLKRLRKVNSDFFDVDNFKSDEEK